MDLDFARRWQAGQAPFDGLTASTEAYIPLSVLSQALRVIVVRLNRLDPDTDLFTLRDNPFDDLFRAIPSPLAWAELLAIVATDETMLEFATHEEFAFFGVFPESRIWYLRFYVPPVDDLPGSEYLPRHGRFDLTGPPNLIKGVSEKIREYGLQLRIGPASDYFDRSRST